MATEVAKEHEVWLVTQTENAPLIDPHLARRSDIRLHPIYFQLSPFWQRTMRLPQGIQFHYYLWQRWLLDCVQRLQDRVRFDVVQHTTFVRYWTPSPLGRLGVPFIWGPVGDGEFTPRSFVRELWPSARVFGWARDAARLIAEWDPALRQTARSAALCLATTSTTAERLGRLGARRALVFPPVTLTTDELELFRKLPPPPPRPFRALCLGRLVYWKGFHLALRSFALFARTKPQAELWLIGDGPERQRLEALAARLGLGGRVTFFGRVASNEDVHALLARCHVLMLPALHEGFPTVGIEAMAAGKPMICLDFAGPAAQVSDGTGFKVSMVHPQRSVEEMAQVLTRLFDSPALLDRVGQAAQHRVQTEFASTTALRRLNQFYHEVAADRAMPPGGPERDLGRAGPGHTRRIG